MLRSPTPSQSPKAGDAARTVTAPAVPMRHVSGGKAKGAPGQAELIMSAGSSESAAAARRVWWLKARIFGLTFLSYAIYSGTRQAFGITKAALNPDREKEPTASGFAPFNSREWGSTYLGACDTVFLAAYGQRTTRHAARGEERRGEERRC